MKFNKRIIALLGAAAMVLPLAACGGNDTAGGNEGGDTSGSDEQIELTVWSWDSTLPRTVEGFEAENPNIKVTITNAGTNTTEYQALNNAMEAGSGAPDGDGKWRIAQMPTLDGSETNAENGGSSLAILATDDTAKAEAAYKFVEYACHNSDGVAVRVEGGAFTDKSITLEEGIASWETALKEYGEQQGYTVE